MDHIQIFTDSSGQNGGIGAAAVLICEGSAPRTLRFYLGTHKEHTVYEAEAVGLTLVAHLLATKRRTTFPASILADNQTVLRFGESMTPKAGHYLIKHFNRIMDNIKKINHRQHFSVTIRWIAAHSVVADNELADEEAKMAAVGRQNKSTEDDLPQYLSSSQLPDSILDIKQAHTKNTRLHWEHLWSKSPRHTRTTAIDPNILSHSFIKLVADLPKQLISLYMYFRTRHIALNLHLHQIKCNETPNCPICTNTEESIHHFLFECPQYGHERFILQ